MLRVSSLEAALGRYFLVQLGATHTASTEHPEFIQTAVQQKNARNNHMSTGLILHEQNSTRFWQKHVRLRNEKCLLTSATGIYVADSPDVPILPRQRAQRNRRFSFQVRVCRRRWIDFMLRPHCALMVRCAPARSYSPTQPTTVSRFCVPVCTTREV